MCGIIGIVGKSAVQQALYDGLTVLQHRGQDAAGIMTLDRKKRIHLHKNNGLVRDVFEASHMMGLKGRAGIGHVRYPTAGSDSAVEAQPFYVNSPYGMSLAHNGNLINTVELQKELFLEDRRHLNTSSDSEVLLNIFAHELERQDRLTLSERDIFNAVAGVHRRCKGAYAAISMLVGYGIVAFRDPFGIRPMVFGKRSTKRGMEYCVASESVALDTLGFEMIRDVEPGEAIYITLDGRLHTQQCAERPRHYPCIFEYVYLARPDSMIDTISVYKARLRMGEYLADRILKLRPNHDIDVVIPIPDTSRTAALPLAHRLGVKYREGFIKNRYIGRTFIMPGQEIRKASVRRKLNAIGLELKGKSALLVDDSIVRGNTSKQIIQMAREAGAKKVYFASAAPPVRYPNVYGIDMPTSEELVAHGRTEEEIEKKLGADWLIYQNLEDLEAACRGSNKTLDGFDTSCFSGKYVTGISESYLKQLELIRSDKVREERRAKIKLVDAG